MANRRPNPERRPLTCENLHEVARAYLPILSFTFGERHFPLRVESWLGHATAADWSGAPTTFHKDDLPLDTHWRGTALMEDRDGQFVHVAGPPNAGNHPVLMAGREAIALDDRRADDSFLDFAGWSDDARRRGDPDYLYSAFSEQAAAIGTENVWEPFDNRPNHPVLWVPQPVSTTTYAEFTLVRSLVGLDRSLHPAGGDFPVGEGGARFTDFDDLLCLTYHFFYAFEDHANGTVPRRREGQWEAASLYFPLGGNLPDLVFAEPPLHAVLTRGQAGDRHDVTTVAWNEVPVVPDGAPSSAATAGANGTQPVFFVAEGTHHLFTDPTGLHPDPPVSPPLDSTLGGGQSAATRFWIVMAFIAWALAVLVWIAAAILAALALAAAAAFLAVIFAILVVVILLIALLCALFCSDDPSTDAQPDTQEAEPDAPSAGDTGDPAGSGSAGNTPGSGGSDQGPDDPAGEPSGGNPGSPTGRNTVPIDLRVVDLVNHAEDTTRWPPGQLCEHPRWWRFSGRWGVRVRPSAAQDWTHGDRRIDDSGRSISYWNTVGLAEALDTDS